MEFVYKNPEWHLTHNEVEFEVWEFLIYGNVISDACAQTIASWRHSPGSPLSTVLSTMGAVTADMTIRDFASVKEYEATTRERQQELDALAAYLKDRQKVRN